MSAFSSVPNQWLEQIQAQLSDIQAKFSKLDVIEQKTRDLSLEIGHLNETLADYEKSVKFVGEQFDGVKDELHQLRDENAVLKGELINLQCRSMMDNLLVKNIEETDGEDTEEVVQNFFRTEMKVQDTVNIEVAHRYGRGWQGGPRPIVVKFSSRKDKAKIKKNGINLKGSKYLVHEQFPKVINDRRKVLYPYLKKAKLDGKRASLNRDDLYIDGKKYTVENVFTCPVKLATARETDYAT